MAEISLFDVTVAFRCVTASVDRV